ncbi:MAG: TlpA family protein disulfide reductase [Pyrinomonadaceae bacterium]
MRLILSTIFCLFLSLSIFAVSGGVPAENFTVTSLDGKTITLEDLRGKVVVLTFWSTRCPICAAEIPKFNQIAAKYAGKDVVFLGLTMENETMVAEHLKKKPFNYTIIPNSLGVIMKYAEKDAAGNFNIAYPSTFILNQNGEIDFKTYGWNKSKTIDSRIGDLLAKK